MSKIAFVTDTDSSLPADLAHEYGISLIPIPVSFGEDTYITGETIDDTRLFEIIDASGKLPTTAAPSPNAYEKAYQAALDDGADHIICICCSSKVSAIFNNAQIAAEAFPEADITVIDSLQVSLALGFMVLYAVEAAQKGADKEAVLELIENLRPRVHVYGALPTLKYLAMGGRMGKLVAGVGNTLEIKPILTSRDGKLDLLEKVRTWKKARNRLVELAEACTEGKSVEKVGMIHVNNEAGVKTLHKQLGERISLPEDYLLAEFTAGLSVHTGSGVVGFVFVTK
ncbi:MAG: DegV family protein [Anaerolineaceae bacterium]|jgi:DegV family protein with EDD domain|nr:DegV family protein [Anaerolineaceae bacterium]